MSRRLLVAALALPLVGCGAARPATDLTLVALNQSVGRAEFHLTCAPAGGDLPRPSATCAALAADPRLLTAPDPFTCAGGPFSWWEIRIDGRLDGKAVHRDVSTCWTPQMTLLARFRIGGWDVLHAHLVPRRREAVMPGSTVTFRAGDLRATDLVTCDILGHRLAAGVPIDAGRPSGVGFAGADVVSVDLRVTRNGDGSVTASCRKGARGPTSRVSHHA